MITDLTKIGNAFFALYGKRLISGKHEHLCCKKIATWPRKTEMPWPRKTVMQLI